MWSSPMGPPARAVPDSLLRAERFLVLRDKPRKQRDERLRFARLKYQEELGGGIAERAHPFGERKAFA